VSGLESKVYFNYISVDCSSILWKQDISERSPGCFLRILLFFLSTFRNVLGHVQKNLSSLHFSNFRFFKQKQIFIILPCFQNILIMLKLSPKACGPCQHHRSNRNDKNVHCHTIDIKLSLPPFRLARKRLKIKQFIFSANVISSLSTLKQTRAKRWVGKSTRRDNE
jgi:hypothetical protein